MSSLARLIANLMIALMVAVVGVAAYPTASHADLVVTNSSDPNKSVVIPEALKNDRDARAKAAQAVGCSLYGTGPGEFDGCSAKANSDRSNPDGYTADDNGVLGGKTVSLRLFDYAVNSGSCMSCTFLSFFMVALSDFSFMVYQYFYDAFLIFAPTTMLIWLGYRAAKLMVTGGEDGKEFLFGVVGKIALFAMVWIFATAANTNNQYFWEFSGPRYLQFGFELSNEIRDSAMKAGNSGLMGGDSGAFQCKEISTSANLPGGTNTTTDGFKYSFVSAALQAGCFTERVHMLGVATGAALAFDSHHVNTNLSIWNMGRLATVGIRMLLKVFIGGMVAAIFGVSAIWLIFLSLDIVTRGMITAAFAPLLLMSYLYKPSRGVAVQAFRGMIGAIATAVAIAVINIVAYVLVTNAPQVFLMTYQSTLNSDDTWEKNEVPLETACGEHAAGLDPSVDRAGAAYNFVCFVGEGDDTKPRIPFDLSTPWFWYLTFCGVAIFGLGRKIIKMIEDIVGYQGASEMANSALKSLKMGVTVGAGAATLGVGGTLMAGAAGGKLLSYGTGAAGKLGGATFGAASNSLKFMGRQMSNGNVLAGANLAGKSMDNIKDE